MLVEGRAGGVKVSVYGTLGDRHAVGCGQESQMGGGEGGMWRRCSLGLCRSGQGIQLLFCRHWRNSHGRLIHPDFHFRKRCLT